MATFSQSTSGSNDSSQYGNGSSASLGTNPVNLTGSTRYALFWFSNVTIPPGSTITAATLTVDVVSTSNDDPNLTIALNDVDSAAAPSSAVDDIYGRAQTAATATWSATGIGAGAKASPDFSSAVQEVIDRGGWASGNNMAVIFDGNATTTFSFHMAEEGVGHEPTLNITYTPPASGGVPVKAIYYARLRG